VISVDLIVFNMGSAYFNIISYDNLQLHPLPFAAPSHVGARLLDSYRNKLLLADHSPP